MPFALLEWSSLFGLRSEKPFLTTLSKAGIPKPLSTLALSGVLVASFVWFHYLLFQEGRDCVHLIHCYIPSP